jgi:hypothetical protein
MERRIKAELVRDYYEKQAAIKEDLEERKKRAKENEKCTLNIYIVGR